MAGKISVQELTVVGDRQHGKTHLLELMALDELLQGRKVLWLTRSAAEARFRHKELAHKVQNMPELADGTYIRYTNGRLAINFPGGGLVRFATANSPYFARGFSLDTVLADDLLNKKQRKHVRREVMPALAGADGMGRLVFTEIPKDTKKKQMKRRIKELEDQVGRLSQKPSYPLSDPSRGGVFTYHPNVPRAAMLNG